MKKQNKFKLAIGVVLVVLLFFVYMVDRFIICLVPWKQTLPFSFYALPPKGTKEHIEIMHKTKTQELGWMMIRLFVLALVVLVYLILK